MPQTTIHFTIDQNGNVKEEVHGLTGYACDKLTKPIENVLGDVESHTHTSEYFKTLPQSQKIEKLEDHDSLPNTEERIEALEDHDWN